MIELRLFKTRLIRELHEAQARGELSLSLAQIEDIAALAVRSALRSGLEISDK